MALGKLELTTDLGTVSVQRDVINRIDCSSADYFFDNLFSHSYLKKNVASFGKFVDEGNRCGCAARDKFVQ